MTENGSSPKPQIIEGPGRYKVYQNPDGSWTIPRAGPICERCQECGCGEQGDPVEIPAMFIALAQSQGGMGRIKAAMKAVRHG